MEHLTKEELDLIECIKLIAEFDGWRGDLSDWEKPSKWFEKWINKSLCSYIYKDLQGNVTNGLLKMQYHTSWEWLMLVVDKIEDIEIDEFKPFAVNIEQTECTIKDYRTPDNSVSYAENENKKLAVFYAIVDFLKWYNEWCNEQKN